jgi:hypothetical protein
MKIINNLKVEIPGTNTHYFHLEDYSVDTKDSVLIYGYDTLEHPPDLSEYKKKIYLNVTMPTEFCSSQSIYADDFFDEIYSICPYSCNWLNELKNTNKYKCVWYPFNSRYIPAEQQKIYDVCYHGGIHGEKHSEMLRILSKFDYRFMTMTRGINPYTSKHLCYATDTNLSFEDKLNIIARSKISVCYNNYPQQSLDKKELHHKNIAFSYVDSHHLMPQLKSRFIEACVSRTLNLVERDSWNVIEKWYKPDKHFVYFNSNEELEDKINDVITNWNSYRDIIDDAYDFSVNNYMCNQLIDRIKNV